MPMPLQDLFQDVNAVSARAVYPTAPGGTLASAGAAISGNTTQGAPNGDTVVVTPSASGKSVGWWVGFVAFLVLMVWAARKAGGEEDFRNIRPTFYNFLTITLTAVVGIVGLKVIAAKWRVPGASDIILAA